MVTFLHSSPLELLCNYHAAPIVQLWGVLKGPLILKFKNKFKYLIHNHCCFLLMF